LNERYRAPIFERIWPPEQNVAVLYEHPEWQKPLFAALERRGVRYAAVDLKHGAFAADDRPLAPLYFNQASPSAYVRGNTRAVPYALAYLRALEIRGVRVLNGAAAFALELSKTAQAALLRTLDIPAPRTWTFNDVGALRERAHEIPFPVLLKPEQGGSGARIVLVERFAQLEELLATQPDYWQPDNLLLLQEYIASDPARGIVRMEFLGGELLYAMRVISHGRFNLCPSPVCNPGEGAEGVWRGAERGAAGRVLRVSRGARAGRRVGQAHPGRGQARCRRHRYLEAPDGQLYFYDVNANSNLRPRSPPSTASIRSSAWSISSCGRGNARRPRRTSGPSPSPFRHAGTLRPG